jgi:hypothetical protein
VRKIGSLRTRPNAKTHLPPKAEARHERTLEAVRCSAVLGADSLPRDGVHSRLTLLLFRQRKGRKNARMSSTNRSGSSMGAK